jgi:7-cyano-7-deazaguanine synthase
MRAESRDSTIGMMLSGGLDSSILLGHLLVEGYRVRPFYVRSGLFWEEAELSAAGRFLGRTRERFAAAGPLVVLDLPLADLYDGHWSLTGMSAPDAASSDDAVYLPGRNALLLLKASLWCQLHGIGQLAIGVLGTNPFADATAGFFNAFEAVVNQCSSSRLTIVRPLAGLTKCQVMERGRGLPLELTFSCIAPVSGMHCGCCNKCAERQAAFRVVAWPDPTPYARSLPGLTADRFPAASCDGQE